MSKTFYCWESGEEGLAIWKAWAEYNADLNQSIHHFQP